MWGGGVMLSDAMQSVARRLGLSLVPYQSDWGFTAVRENDDRFFVFVLNSGEWSIYRAADVGLAERSSSPIRGDSTEPGWTPPPTTSPHNAGAGSKTPSWRGFLKFARVPQINVPPASSPTALIESGSVVSGLARRQRFRWWDYVRFFAL